MHFWKRFSHSKSFFILLVFLFSVALSAVVSLSKSVENQSLLERQSLTPAFDIIIEEVLKPLFIAETVARASPLKLILDLGVPDEKALVLKLQDLASEFDMVFFAASEKTLKQYNSDGTIFPLEPEKVEWYFRAKEMDQNVFAAIGNKENIHIYFDIKIFNKKQEFVGFIGVGRTLQSFMQSFEKIKSRLNYDFVFVNQNDDIVLSSDATLVADGKSIKKLQDLPWFKVLTDTQQSKAPLADNLLVKLDGEDLLIARADLKALNWQLYLVNSLNARQNNSLLAFIELTLYIVVLLLLGLVIGYFLLAYLQNEFANKHQNDPLTKLPNRAHLDWRFQQIISEEKPLCAVMVDIDHFKKINDTYGHVVGDQILVAFAELLKSLLRSADVIGRWGGEEFLMLLPDTKLNTAFDVADRARKVIALHAFQAGDKTLYITASFGVAFEKQPKNLEKLIEQADTALYFSKAKGRNAVNTTKDVELDKLLQPPAAP
ncbi:sensor domain-containing diguanylate cyclase [Paraglaciecola aestuariivivens]